jgi:hypothetical protein
MSPVYATLSHVAAIAAKRVFTATSIPNASQVQMFLEHAQAEVDGILGGDGYQVPVPTSATISLKLLERIVTIGAWAQVEKSAQVSADAKEAVAAWEQARTELIKGTVQLVDAPRLGGENFARVAPYATPFFTRNMEL